MANIFSLKKMVKMVRFVLCVFYHNLKNNKEK